MRISTAIAAATISAGLLLVGCGGGADDEREPTTFTPIPDDVFSSALEAPPTSANRGGEELGATEQRLREKRVISVCQRSVRQQLKDPDSAQFQKELAVPATPEGLVWVVTGQVNAQNGFGGMVGFTPYRCNATYDPADESTEGNATIAE